MRKKIAWLCSFGILGALLLIIGVNIEGALNERAVLREEHNKQVAQTKDKEQDMR